MYVYLHYTTNEDTLRSLFKCFSHYCYFNRLYRYLKFDLCDKDKCLGLLYKLMQITLISWHLHCFWRLQILLHPIGYHTTGYLLPRSANTWNVTVSTVVANWKKKKKKQSTHEGRKGKLFTLVTTDDVGWNRVPLIMCDVCHSDKIW